MHRIILFLTLCLAAFPAHAEFLISSAILEFTKEGPRQQDIEIVSRSQESDYIVAEIREIVHPGLPDESSRTVENPEQGGLLVTPDKTVLAAGTRKVLRFVLLKEPDAQEHIYRVAIRPVIKGVEQNAKLGLKVLVGYEALVIVRPAAPAPAYSAERHGRELRVSNSGNTNVLFEYGKQCPTAAAPADQCKMLQVTRVYPGATTSIPLLFDTPAAFSIWNGKETAQKEF